MNDYDPIQKAQDATEFAQSRFGQHYLELLGTVRDDHYKRARTLQKNGEDNLALGELARADEADGLLDYFHTAQAVNSDPTLRERILKNIRRKGEKADS